MRKVGGDKYVRSMGDANPDSRVFKGDNGFPGKPEKEIQNAESYGWRCNHMEKFFPVRCLRHEADISLRNRGDNAGTGTGQRLRGENNKRRLLLVSGGCIRQCEGSDYKGVHGGYHGYF